MCCVTIKGLTQQKAKPLRYTKLKKSAIFIAGDENIYFPALVAIESIREHNPDVFDYFMCFSGDKLTPYMERTLRGKDIHFMDIRELGRYGINEKFSAMSEGHWPVEVFYNYVIPMHLGELGYDYSYKVDYDILCTGKYNLEEIQPTAVGISGWSNKLNLSSPGVPRNVIDALKSKGMISSETVSYMNVGFIGFNNKIYAQKDMFGTFTEAYKYLHEACPQAKLLEQIAFALLLESTNGEFISVSEAYNHRVLATRHSDGEFNFDTKNIHFITKFKPWRKLEKDKFRWFIFNGGNHLFLYRNIWLEFAEKVDGFEFFCMERPLTTMQMIGVNMYATQCFNEKINSLKAESQA